MYLYKEKSRILVRKVEYLKDIHKPKNIGGIFGFGEYSQRLPSKKNKNLLKKNPTSLKTFILTTTVVLCKLCMNSVEKF